MVIAAARVLARRHAEMCGVNADDTWTHYAEDFKADAEEALKAAGALLLLDFAVGVERLFADAEMRGLHLDEDKVFIRTKARAAILAATGGGE
jgi:hypothetical protein